MSNAFGNYIPQMWANEALPHLRNSLGLAGRVLHTYEDERRAFNKGDTINIRRPSRFAVTDAPATAADLTTEDVAITINQWRETKWLATDKELSFTDPRVVSEHVRPAAYSLAGDVNAKLHALTDTELGTQFSQATGAPASIVVADLLGARAQLQDNGVPMNDGRLHLCLDGSAETALLSLSQFSQHQGAGLEGVNTQRDGDLGRKFGINLFQDNQAGLQTYTSGTAGRTAGDSAGSAKTAFPVGTTEIHLDDLTDAQTIAAGDQITFAGHKAHYTVAVGDTVGAGGASAAATEAIITLAEGLIEPVVITEVVTVLGSETTHTDPLVMFHENAFALVTAPIASDHLEKLGVMVGRATDEDAGISVRTRIYAVPNSSQVHFAMDILFGVKVLNSMYACKLLR
jgi:hypothetical protein